MEDIGGVWRTIGGRRVFIKTGQSLSSAMKESGKFNKKYDGSMKEEGKERYFEDKDGNKIEYLTTKEYNKICEDFDNVLTDEERKELLNYVDTPLTAGSSMLNRQKSPDDPEHLRYAYNKNPDNLMTEYEADMIRWKEYESLPEEIKRDSYDLRNESEKRGYGEYGLDEPDKENRERIEHYKKDPNYIEHNRELMNLSNERDAKLAEIRAKYTNYNDYYEDYEREDIEKEYETIIKNKAEEYGLPYYSAYGYKKNIDYFETKNAYLKRDELEWVTEYRMIQNIREGKTANQAQSILEEVNATIKSQNTIDKIFNEKGIAFDKDIIVYRRSHEDKSTILEGFTRYGYTSTTAKSSLPKKMPSGVPFGETEIELIIPAGTKIVPLKGVIEHRMKQTTDPDEIKMNQGVMRQNEILLPRESKFKFVGMDSKWNRDKWKDEIKYTMTIDTGKVDQDFKYKLKEKVNGKWVYKY